MISEPIPARELIETALGNRPADLVITNGTLVDVYSKRLIPRRSVAVYDKWIVYVGPDAGHTINDQTQVIEAEGRLICPGYIDAHTHLANCWSISDFLGYALPCGVTTFITEVESYALALGADGFKAFLDQIEPIPAKVFALIPPLISASPAVEHLYVDRDTARELLKDPRVLGIGESYWQRIVLKDDDRVLGLIQDTINAGKSVQGHAAGAFDRKLSAYAASGAVSCHEAITTEDVLSRLELGYYTMIREGDIRRDLEIILPLKDRIDTRRLILVTDGTNPSLLVKQGYLVDVIQKAVDMGFDPLEVLQMVTLNPAQHFGLDALTGGIAPGRRADILLLPEPGNMSPDLVISDGRVVAEKGDIRIALERVPHPEAFYHTLRTGPVSAADLSAPASNSASDHRIRIMEIQPGGLVTREQTVEGKVEGGDYVADVENDLLKVVFIERVTGKGERFTGFIKGWGQKKGAVASSLCWDASGVMAIGTNENDIALAINRIIDLRGGTTLFVDGELKLEIPFSVGGCVSELGIRELAERLERFQQMVASLGSELDSAHLTLNTLSTAAIPFIRMTEQGYYRFRENDIVGLG
ncbi:MAG: adenine deaminase [Deltaproteobacteria bacterium]|nr:adenine deaminase [Deltaproteobacteria bacterium]